MGTKYNWKIGLPPPYIGTHSFAKHRVYESYLSHYIQVLNTNPKIPEFDLTVVDGFAGGGEYLDPNKQIYQGSPIRLLKAAQAGQEAVNQKREQSGMQKQFLLNVDFHFIEKIKNNYLYLEKYLKDQGYADYLNKGLYLYQADFSKALPALIDQIKKKKKTQRCLFFLDQYGYSDVPFSDIRKIFRHLPNAEIILTFATDFLIDFMSSDEKYMKPIINMGLDTKLNIEQLLDVKKDTPLWRQYVQFKLHDSILELSSAKFYTPFFITSSESNKSFWLVHLSNHHRARDVMTELHWQLKNHFTHYADVGIKMFGYDPLKDDLLSGQRGFFEEGEYSFDEIAKKRTMEKLIVELPNLLNDYKDGVKYELLYARVANNTPATSEHIKEALGILFNHKELLIHNASGVRKRVAKSISKGDMIELNRQITLIPSNYR